MVAAYLSDDGRWEPYTEEGKGEIFFLCDDCHAVLETGHESFYHAWARMRAVGWRGFKLDNKWQHFCAFSVVNFRTAFTAGLSRW
jgi:hypothetical protein